MAKICEICGKKPAMGQTIVRRGLAKKKGGVGKKITGITKRLFKPNIQHIRVVVNNQVKRMKVCTRCLHAGKIIKPYQIEKAG